MYFPLILIPFYVLLYIGLTESDDVFYHEIGASLANESFFE